jgi:2,5-diketo-D-gluconate reductase A
MRDVPTITLNNNVQIFVTTKLWNSDHGYEQALCAFDTSARRLGLDTVDLYLIHWPVPAADRYVETWKALEKLAADGRVRAARMRENLDVFGFELSAEDLSAIAALNTGKRMGPDPATFALT